MFQKPSPDIALSSSPKAANPHDDVQTVVGPSVHVEGDFASEGDILVKGMVSGNVTTSRVLTVEQGAKILANVKAGEAMVAGDIKGNVRVQGKLELTESAQVHGDVTCKTLVVSAGALMHGKVTMKGISIDGPKPEKKRVLGRAKSKTETATKS